jgi:hypothetical protein
LKRSLFCRPSKSNAILNINRKINHNDHQLESPVTPTITLAATKKKDPKNIKQQQQFHSQQLIQPVISTQNVKSATLRTAVCCSTQNKDPATSNVNSVLYNKPINLTHIV